MSVKKVFECRLCGECCQGKGGIVMKREEARETAALLGLELDEFVSRYTVLRHGMLSIRTDVDGRCVFQDRDSGACRIHGAKPRMCRDWPFFHGTLASRQGFEEARNACPGIAADATWEEFVEYHRTHVGVRPPLTYIETLIADRKDHGS